ncbi:hypothetical protein HYR54_12595 [Candidatus Acetothermia bacterium]|nr:hypothetical protein [Candidatus Acetothermia bacterium]
MTMAPEIQTLLDRVQAGEELHQSDRIEALEYLERTESLNATQLAAMLGVTTRQIARDRARLRARYQQALKDLDLIGELHRQWCITLERMDRAINSGDHPTVKSLSLRWGVCESFAKIGVNFQMDELAQLIERVKAKEATNGHASLTGNDPETIERIDASA